MYATRSDYWRRKEWIRLFKKYSQKNMSDYDLYLLRSAEAQIEPDYENNDD